MEYLTVKEVSEIKKCSVQYIRKNCKDGKIDCKTELNSKSRMKYLIPVSALSEQEQAIYYKQVKEKIGLSPGLIQEAEKPLKQHSKTVKKAFEEYSEDERKEMAVWCKILQEWQSVRIKYKSKANADEDFIGKCRIEHPDIEISRDILYRKYSAYVNNDYDGLVDHRGGHNKGQSAIAPKVWGIFASLYLTYQNPKISNCYRTTVAWCKTHYPELVADMPSERTFRRRVKSELEGAVSSYIRDGEAKCLAKYGIFAERDYDKLEANDVWIFDNHTLDIVSMSPNGKPHRMSITTIQDAKSGVIVGCNPCDDPCSESTLLAVRRAVMNGYGIPKYWYLDNGSEFSTHDIATRGHRKKASWNKGDDPPTILELLGIKSIFALVANPDAKNIERFFYTFKEWFSKAQNGYCGGTILERHPALKGKIKNGEIPTDDEVMNLIEVFIRSYNSGNYGGKEAKYKGNSRIDVWNKSINSERTTFRDVASDEELTLLLARTSRYQKIKRNGVFVSMYGKKIWFRNEDTPFNIGKEVYVRYDPSCLDNVRVYDKETDEYLWTYPRADYLDVPYLAVDSEEGREKIKTYQVNYARTREAIKKRVEDYTQSPEAIDYVSARINEMELSSQNYEIKRPAKFEPITAKEANIESPERENIVAVDFSELEELRAMNDRLEKAKGA